jgi:hypothetical protein
MRLSKFSINAATKVEVMIVRWRWSRNSTMLEGKVQHTVVPQQRGSKRYKARKRCAVSQHDAQRAFKLSSVQPTARNGSW